MRCYMFIFSLVAVLGGGFRYVHVQLLLGMMMGHPQVRICFKSTKTTKLRIYIYLIAQLLFSWDIHHSTLGGGAGSPTKSQKKN